MNIILNMCCPYIVAGFVFYLNGNLFSFSSIFILSLMGFCHFYAFNLGLTTGASYSDHFDRDKSFSKDMISLVDQKLEEDGVDIDNMSSKELELKIKDLMKNDSYLQLLIKTNNIRYEKKSEMED